MIGLRTEQQNNCKAKCLVCVMQAYKLSACSGMFLEKQHITQTKKEYSCKELRCIFFSHVFPLDAFQSLIEDTFTIAKTYALYMKDFAFIILEIHQRNGAQTMQVVPFVV